MKWVVIYSIDIFIINIDRAMCPCGSDKMKKIFYSIPFIILFLFMYFNTGLAQDGTGPKMVIEQKEYDAKEVKQGEVINHTFKILNTGDQALEIKSVKPG